MSKIAFITGATSGIGRATALLLARNGFKIIAAGRRQDRLTALRSEIGSENIQTLTFDVRDRQAVKMALASLPESWKQIDVLLNNAGNAHGLASVQEGDEQDWDLMLDINIKGLLNVTKAALPFLKRQHQGHIINIGSIAGKEVYPNGNVYCASKFAVDALNKGMRIDLLKEGIKVSEINPGMVETEFAEVRFKGDKDRAETAYRGYKALQAEDIADLILFTVTRPAHVNLAEILILPSAQASTTIFDKK